MSFVFRKVLEICVLGEQLLALNNKNKLRDL
jgi:hypothetical protein